MNKIPCDLQKHLLGYLSFNDMLTTRQVSKRWKDFIARLKCYGYALTNTSLGVPSFEKRLSVEKKVHDLFSHGKDITDVNTVVFGDVKVEDKEIDRLLTQIRVTIIDFDHGEYIWRICSDSNYIAYTTYTQKIKVLSIDNKGLHDHCSIVSDPGGNIAHLDILYPHVIISRTDHSEIWKVNDDKTPRLLFEIDEDARYRLTKSFIYFKTRNTFKIYTYDGVLIREIMSPYIEQFHWNYFIDDIYMNIYDPLQDDIDNLIVYTFHKTNAFTNDLRGSKATYPSISILKKYDIILRTDDNNVVAYDTKDWKRLWSIDCRFANFTYNYNPVYPHVYVSYMDGMSGSSIVLRLNAFDGKMENEDKDSWGEMGLEFIMGKHTMGHTGYYATVNYSGNGSVMPFTLLSMKNGRIVCHNVIQANGIVVYDFN